MLNNNKHITCVLVDDEKKVMQALEFTLNQHVPELQILGKANNVEEAFTLINNTHPDIVFLDIVMPKETGFELIKKFDNIDFEIVFITSHQQYALEAIRCLALAYLLKPVAIDDLLATVAIIRERLELKHKKLLYDALLYNMEKGNIKDHKLAIYNHNNTELYNIKDIVRVEGWDRYTRIYVKSVGVITSSYNIGRYAAALQHHGFFLCHKSHMINLDYVKRVTADNHLELYDRTMVPLAVRKRAEFIDRFQRLL